MSKVSFINQIIAFLVLFYISGYCYNKWKYTQEFYYAFVCGGSFFASALFLRNVVWAILKGKPKEEEKPQTYNGKRKEAKDKLKAIKEYVKKMFPNGKEK